MGGMGLCIIAQNSSWGSISGSPSGLKKSTVTSSIATVFAINSVLLSSSSCCSATSSGANLAGESSIYYMVFKHNKVLLKYHFTGQGALNK
jgi:hypothetical protein